MDKKQRIALACKAVKGVSIGDAFGESFFGDRNTIITHIQKREIPNTSWEFTDDTVMTIAVLEQLEVNGTINQDELAQIFVKNHNIDVNRGYGATARRILRAIDRGSDWKVVSQSVFDGMGSMGNGAGMRVSPIGAYHYDNIDSVKKLAIASAEITHANIEGITGAIAVSVATALTTRINVFKESYSPVEFIEKIVEQLPETDTKYKIQKAKSIPYSYSIETLKTILGNGSQMMAQDTIPYAIWCAAYNLDDFEEGLWKAVSILGDRDTICAIVGGIIMMSTNNENIPMKWWNSVEDYETSSFRGKLNKQ